jgi:hypothetical protein
MRFGSGKVTVTRTMLLDHTQDVAFSHELPCLAGNHDASSSGHGLPHQFYVSDLTPSDLLLIPSQGNVILGADDSNNRPARDGVRARPKAPDLFDRQLSRHGRNHAPRPSTGVRIRRGCKSVLVILREPFTR